MSCKHIRAYFSAARITAGRSPRHSGVTVQRLAQVDYEVMGLLGAAIALYGFFFYQKIVDNGGLAV